MKIFLKLMPMLVLILAVSCQQATTSEQEISGTIDGIEFTTESLEAHEAFKEGLAQFDLDNYQEARKQFDVSIQHDPMFTSAYIFRSFTSGSASEFAADAKKAMTLTEGISEAETALLSLLDSYMTGNNNKEMEACKRIVDLHPNSARAHRMLGFAFGSNEDVDNARKEFQKSIELQPDWVGGYFALANSQIFDEPKDLANAEANMRKVLELTPANPRAHIAVGDVLRAQQDLENALVSYKKAAELSAKDPIAYTKAGHVNSLLGNFEEARDNYRTAFLYSDNKAALINYKAFTYLYAGEPELALQYLNNQAGRLNELGVKASRLTQTKLNCIKSCAWIALHHEYKDYLKEILVELGPLTDQIAIEIGTDEAKLMTDGEKMFWESIALALHENLDEALALTEEMKDHLEPIYNASKLNKYHLAQGFIRIKQGDFAGALESLQKGDKNDNYNKYLMAMAFEGAGKVEQSLDLLDEISSYNFNDIGFALVRKNIKKKLAV